MWLNCYDAASFLESWGKSLPFYSIQVWPISLKRQNVLIYCKTIYMKGSHTFGATELCIPTPARWCQQTAKHAINSFEVNCLQLKVSVIGVFVLDTVTERWKTFGLGRRASAAHRWLYSMCSHTKDSTTLWFNWNISTISTPGFVMALRRACELIMQESRTIISILILTLFLPSHDSGGGSVLVEPIHHIHDYVVRDYNRGEL